MSTEEKDYEVSQAEKKGRERAQLVMTYLNPNINYTFNWTKPQKDPVDLWMTATTTNKLKTYVGDIKSYLNPKHPRDLYEHPDYMVDYDKLRQIKKRAKNDEEYPRTPILIAVFPTYLAIWDLNKCDWEHTAEWRLVVQTGVDYGKREWELMAFLPLGAATIMHYDINEMNAKPEQ